MHDNDARMPLLLSFVQRHAGLYGLDAATIAPASADASFRRYFRILGKAAQGKQTSYIIMDAPPSHEDCEPFIKVASLLGEAGLNVPDVLEQDLVQGFLLLKDLGSTTYLNALQSGADHRPLYADAVTALVKLQAASATKPTALPAYDAVKLKQEMSLFEDWFLIKHHSIVLNDRERALLQVAIKLISDASTRQTSVWVHRDYHCRNLMVTDAANPGVLDFQDAVCGPYTYDLVSLLRDAYIDWPEEAQIELALLQVAIKLISDASTRQASVWVHRDYHCRNLMVTDTANPGVLDFQDAVYGPYTYDLVSLLRDAYIDWPEEAQIELALDYWKKAQAAGVPVPEDFGELWRDFEWMGLQRHLKVLGIFARLYHRDGKDGYLKDIPLVMQYAQRVAQRYDGLGILVRLFDRVQGVERKVGVTF